MDREESFKLVKNQKRRVVACGITAALVAVGDGICIPAQLGLFKDTAEKFSRDPLTMKIGGITCCAAGFVACIILTKRMINKLSFCKALRRHLEQYSDSYIGVTPEEYKKNESIYGIQYTKNRRALRRQGVEDYKEEALSTLGILR